MTEATYDIIVAGEVNPDLILSHPTFAMNFEQEEILLEAADLEIGSSNAIFACGAARLGLRVALIGVVGDDLFASYMLGALDQRGVDTSHIIIDRDLKTGISVILTRGGQRTILTYLGAMNALRAEGVPDELLSRTRHLHIASYFLQTSLQPGLPGLFRRARELGVTTSLDTNWDPGGSWTGVHSLLPLTDVFLPNEFEASALTQLADPRAAAFALAEYGSIVAVKQGGAGGLVVGDGQYFECPSLPVQVVDTVGAGDSFDAGFIYGYLHGWSLERSLRLANVCGALSTRQAGGVRSQPDFEEAERHL